MPTPLIGIVGPCAAGKTTLGKGLRAHGFNARPILQEHSYVPTMWQRITRPDVLIYLEADLQTIRWRRHDPEFPAGLLAEELDRLRHARAHADIVICTDHLTPDEVLAAATARLAALGVTPVLF